MSALEQVSIKDVSVHCCTCTNIPQHDAATTTLHCRDGTGQVMSGEFTTGGLQSAMKTVDQLKQDALELDSVCHGKGCEYSSTSYTFVFSRFARISSKLFHFVIIRDVMYNLVHFGIRHN